MKKRRVGVAFNYRDCDAFAGYLHEQSLQGWHFKEFRLGLVFEHGEPADIYYAVEVFPKGTEMDTRPEESTEEYAEYCDAAGWKLIDSSRKFCVFRRTREDAVPIVEPEERFANIRKAEWLFWLNGTAPVFLLTCLDWFQLLTSGFNSWIFNNALLLILLVMTLCLAERLCGGICLLYWSVTRRRMLRAGDIPVYGRGKRRPFRTVLPLVLLLVSAVFLAYSRDEYFLLYVLTAGITLIFILLAALWVAFRRPSRNDNWSFQLVAGLGICFSFLIVMTAVIIGGDSSDKSALENTGDFPLIQADYRQIDGEITSAHADYMKSVLGSAEHFYIDYNIEESGEPNRESRSDSLWYTVYRSPHSWVLDKLWKNELSKLAGHPEDRTEAWGAVSAASRAGENRVCNELVRYPDSILAIRTDERLDDGQVRMIFEKLMM